MKVKSNELINEKKPILKRLLSLLQKDYEYVSILMTCRNGKNYSISKSGVNIAQSTFSELGYVIKVYDGNSYMEYSFSKIDNSDINSIIKKIKEGVENFKDANNYPIISEEEVKFEKSTEYKIDPATLGDEGIINKITAIREKILSSDEKILDGRVVTSFESYNKLFLSPKKEMIQNVMYSTGSIVAMAPLGDEMKVCFETASVCGGMEVLEILESKINKLIDSLNNLLISKQITPGEYDCICAPDVTGMIVHEAFGHGVEMDMFVKDRALASKYIGKQVASNLVTMHDGAAAAKETASYFFDDEGTLSKDTIIIEKGVLKRGLCDLQSAMALNVEPTGNGRREKSSHKIYTRMTNTFFEAGNDNLEDMISSIKYGFYLENASSGMEDPKNWGIQCMVDIAREIKDGKFTGKVFSPIVLTGYVPDLLKSITMMSKDFHLSGSGMCGKGYKEWVKVSDGGPYIKARIRLG